ncbi:MAG: hypothetical protein ACIARQ_04430 [Phycisphaerales bacterium JB061]
MPHSRIHRRITIERSSRDEPIDKEQVAGDLVRTWGMANLAGFVLISLTATATALWWPAGVFTAIAGIVCFSYAMWAVAGDWHWSNPDALRAIGHKRRLRLGFMQTCLTIGAFALSFIIAAQVVKHSSWAKTRLNQQISSLTGHKTP